jgi:hypothetical protein
VTSVASALDDWPEDFFRFCDKFDMVALQNLWRLWSDYHGGRLSKTKGSRLVLVALIMVELTPQMDVSIERVVDQYGNKKKRTAPRSSGGTKGRI